MLSKLIGYEFRATRRIFFPAYLALLVLSVLNAVSFALSPNLEHISLPTGLLMMVYVVVIMAIAFLSLAYMIVRFYQNLLGDEGYLMFTLPVRPSQLLWSKAIVSTVWMAASVILCGISILIVTLGVAIAEGAFGSFLQELPLLWARLVSVSGVSGGFLAAISVEVIVGILIGVIAFCMQVYAALSLGQLFHRFRLGMSFAMYIVCSIAEQLVFLPFGKAIDMMPLPLDGQTGVAVAILLMILWTALTAVVYYIISNYLLSRRLNLQ